MRVLALLLVLSWAGIAHAELYSYTDDDGVIHFTNLPDDPRYEPQQVDKRQNSFEWRDDLGTLRQVHKVDVKKYDDLIVEAARYYSLPAAIVKAVVAVESSFEAGAVSPKGAQGLMQLMAETAKKMFVKDVFDARDNIYGGSRYLRVLANRFDGDLRRTVAAYNCGPQAVERFGDVPPFEETRMYVKRVLALYRHYLANWRPEGQ